MLVSSWTRNIRVAQVNKQCWSKRSLECACREKGKDFGLCRDWWREGSLSRKRNQSLYWKPRAATKLLKSWQENENSYSPHAAVWLGQQAEAGTAFQARPQLSHSLAWYWICQTPNMHMYVHLCRHRAGVPAANRSFGSGLGAQNRPRQSNWKNWENEEYGGSGEGRQQGTDRLIDGFCQSLSLQNRSNHRPYIHNCMRMAMSQLNL